MDSDAGTALEEIDRDECVRLLGASSVGRLAVVDDGRPFVVPVNYALTPDGILVVTDAGTKLEAGAQRVVALEVDEIDEATHTGWSVLVRGHAYDVTDTLDDASARLQSVELASWAPGPKSRRLVVELEEVSGRRLSASARDTRQ